MGAWSSIALEPYVPAFSLCLLALLFLASAALSFSVWRRRHIALAGGRSSRPGLVPFRIVLGCVVIGMLLMSVAVVFGLFVARKGPLHAHDVLVVRADPTRGDARLTDHEQVGEGEPIVVFEAPETDAELSVLDLERRRLTSERERLERTPLDHDAELVRERQSLAAERRALQQRHSQLAIEQRRLEHQTTSELLEKRIRLHELRVDLAARSEKRREIAARIAHSETMLNAGKKLNEDLVLSPVELSERTRDLAVLQSAAIGLDRTQEEVHRLEGDLAQGIRELESLLEHTRIENRQRLELLDAELDEIERKSRCLESQMKHEEDRLAESRSRRLEEVSLRVEGCGERARKLRAEREERAPFSGRVIYRHPSPGAAAAGVPILALAKPDSVRARIRLSKAGALALADAGSVSLLSDADVLDPRFCGRLMSWKPLTEEPDTVIAELACEMGPDLLRAVLEEQRVEARLLWAPPLVRNPVFLLGALLVGLGCLPSLLSRLPGVTPGLLARGPAPAFLQKVKESLSQRAPE